MTILTDKSLDEAINICRENSGYRVLIVTKRIADHDEILNYLQKVGADVTRCFGNPWAKFENNSIIRLMSIRENMCGHRAHLVLCQEKVYTDCEDVELITSAIEVPYNPQFINYDDDFRENLIQHFSNNYTREEILAAIEKTLNKE